MTAANPAAAERTADLRRVALWYEPPPGIAGRVWVPVGGSQHAVVSDAFKSRLLAAVLELQPQPGARLVVLGTEIGPLAPRERTARRERTALRARIAFLPANGGLISNLNGWENITLPLGYHDPGRLRTVAPRIYALLEALGADPRPLLEKLPEAMSLYEKKAAGYVRILLEAPELVVAENLAGGLEPEERRRSAKFADAYLADRPDGTFVQLEDVPDE